MTKDTLRFTLAAAVVLLLASAGLPPSTADAAVRVEAPLTSDLAAIEETMRLPAATWLNDRDGDKVFDSLEQRFSEVDGSALSIIVTFRHGVAFGDAMATAQAAAGGFDVRYEYPNLGGFNAVLGLDAVKRIATLDVVRQVEWDQPGKAELDTATESFGVRSVQNYLGINGDGDGLVANYTGQDVSIAILDTGFHGDHVDLKGKFRIFYDAANQTDQEPYDSGTHGTHVASIAGGLGRGNPEYTGVAPGAGFVGFKITDGKPYDEQPEGSKAGALWAYDKIIEVKDEFNIRVATISFGFGTTVDGTDALELAVDKVWAAGVVATKSTGNEGPERSTVTVPGGARGIISVANMIDPGPSENPTTATWLGASKPMVPDYGFHLRSSSSRGPTEDGRVKPDIAAPGSSIMAADAESKDGYVPKTGTSMAAPFTAGVVALMTDADPTLTPDEVREILFATADDWGVPGPDVEYGNGRLNALAAVQTVLIDRLVRERAPYEEILRVSEAPQPDIPFHANGILSGVGPQQATFEVEDADAPLALTVILNETLVVQRIDYPDPLGHYDVRAPRVVVVELLGPDDGVVGKIVIPSTAPRQFEMFFIPEVTGTYTLRTLELSGMDLVWDVSAGLPPPEEGLRVVAVPDAEEYANLLAGESPETDAPGPGFLAALTVLGLAWAWRRRARGGE